MKILYGIQLNGNGHITRSTQIINSLISNNIEVDIITSGENSQIDIPFDVIQHFKGVSIYYDKKGKVDWLKTFRKVDFSSFFSDIIYDSTSYDLVISDFEPISSWSANINGIKSIGFGNQYSFLSDNLPRPSKKDKISESFIKKFAKCKYNIGLGYERYDDFIFKPIINECLLNKNIEDQGFYLLYLPSIPLKDITNNLNKFKNHKWKIYSSQILTNEKIGNIEFNKLNKDRFQDDLIRCKGIITASGFSTTSEALILNKKLWSIPIKGQYEQICNSVALKKMGIFTDDFNKQSINKWIEEYEEINYQWENPIDDIIKKIKSINDAG
jgi:uncharacterized protein (TIGR00661 family)